MRRNFPINNSTCPIMNKNSPFDKSNEYNVDWIDKVKRGLCHKINVKYFPSPANEMQFSDRELSPSDRQ